MPILELKQVSPQATNLMSRSLIFPEKNQLFFSGCFHFAVTFHICCCRCQRLELELLGRGQERSLTPWHGDMFERKKDTLAAPPPCLDRPACPGDGDGWCRAREKRVNLDQHWKKIAKVAENGSARNQSLSRTFPGSRVFREPVVVCWNSFFDKKVFLRTQK